MSLSSKYFEEFSRNINSPLIFLSLSSPLLSHYKMQHYKCLKRVMKLSLLEMFIILAQIYNIDWSGTG